MKRKTPGKKKQLSKKSMALWVILMVIFFSELFFYAKCRVECVRIGYEISRQQHRTRTLLTEQRSLKVELASLKSPKRLARLAETELGLSLPRQDQMITLP